jgi:DNA-binding CsgD family transcriptional regulator
MAVSLTHREIEVLAHIAQGMTAAEIATLLGITKRTVDAHMQSIREELNASNTAHAVAVAVTLGLIKL